MTKYKLLVVGAGSIGERHVRCFLNTERVEGKAQPLCSLAEGIATLKVNLAALQSAQDRTKFLTIDGTCNGND